MLKGEVMERLRRHRAEDSIVQSYYQWVDPELASGYRGCLIGCTLPLQETEAPDLDDDDASFPVAPPGGWQRRVEELYGIALPVVHLMETVFERIPAHEAGDFAVASVDAVPVGADLSLVPARLLLEYFTQPASGFLLPSPATPGAGLVALTATVVGLLRRLIAGEKPSTGEWRRAVAEGRVLYMATSGERERIATALLAAAKFGGGGWGTAGSAAEAIVLGQMSWLGERLIHHLGGAPVLAAASP